MLSGCCWDLGGGFCFWVWLWVWSGCLVLWRVSWFEFLDDLRWGLRYSTGVWGLLVLVSGLGDFQVCVLVCYFRFCGLWWDCVSACLVLGFVGV